MKRKIGFTILVIYTALFIFVLPYFHASGFVYTKNYDRQVWLTNLVSPNWVYVWVGPDDLFSEFIDAVDRMYRGGHLILPPDLFRIEDLITAGVTVSVTSTSNLQPCTHQALARYRKAAAISLFYTPL